MALQLPELYGPWQAKITRIKAMWVQPCLINPIVWMTGFFAASPVILFHILSPDCLDATADRVRRGHRKNRKGALNIFDHQKPLNAPSGAAGYIAFKLFGMAQRIGWYMTIIDAYGDFIIHGTSFAYQWSGCQDPNQGRAALEMVNVVPALLPEATFVVNTWHFVEEHIFSAGPTGIATPKGHAVGIGMTLTQQMNRFPGLPDCSWTARVEDFAANTFTNQFDPVTNPDGSRGVTWFRPDAGAADESHLYRVIITKTFGVLLMDGNFTASGVNLEGVAKSACGHSIPKGD